MYLPVFGEDKVDGILDEMRDSYEALIPNIPFIGDAIIICNGISRMLRSWPSLRLQKRMA